MPTDGPRAGPWAAAAIRSLLRLGAIVLFAYGIHLLIGWTMTALEDAHLGMRMGLLTLLIVVYAVLIALPFVPGVEIGLSLLAIEGGRIAPFVYLAAVAGLYLAFSAGQWMPYRRLRRAFEDLRLHRACALLDRTQPLSRSERLALLRDRAPKWIRPFALRYRYLLLGLLVNLPGNSLIGGGGGILFVAGLSRLFHPVTLAATLAIAVLPVPLTVWLFDIDLLSLAQNLTR